MTVGKYDRWLKDVHPWAHEEDWDPKEYFNWVKALSEAKAKLDGTFRSVDNSLIKDVAQCADYYRDVMINGENGKPGKKRNAQVVPTNVAKLIVRYVIAFNFYARATFEEIEDRALVTRVQQHLVELNIGMLDIDIAHMLQCAADKVPIKEAVVDKVTDFVSKIKEGLPISKAYAQDGFGSKTPRFIELLNQTRVKEGLPDRAKIPTIFSQINKEEEARGLSAWKDHTLQNLKKVLSDDEQMELFLRVRGDPQLDGYHDEDEITVIEDMLAARDIGWVVDEAVKLEGEKCSWDGNIGPALKAIRRLGRTSAGQGYEDLAQYAKDHQKPKL